MITDVSSVLPYYEEDNYTTKEEDKLGRDAFMTLFLAQLNQQDPLNPMDTTQFSSQLAQFSTLEQLFNVNENLESIEGIQSSDSRYQILNLVGKKVQVESDTLILNNGEPAEGAFYLDTPAKCTVRIYDERGVAIKDIDLGSLEAGNRSFEWNGTDDYETVHTTGSYSYKVSAISSTGESVAVDRYIQGTVSRVNMNTDEPVLYIGDTPLYMSQVVNVINNAESID